MYFNRLSHIAEPDVDGDAAPRPSRLYVSYKNIEVFAGLADIVVITLSSVLGVQLYQYLWFGAGAGFETSLGVGLSQALLYTYVASSRGLYRLPVLLAPSRYLARIFTTWAIVVLFVAIFLVFLRGEAAKGRTLFTRQLSVKYSFQIASFSARPGRSRKNTPSNRSALVNSGGSLETSLLVATTKVSDVRSLSQVNNVPNIRVETPPSPA